MRWVPNQAALRCCQGSQLSDRIQIVESTLSTTLPPLPLLVKAQEKWGTPLGFGNGDQTLAAEPSQGHCTPSAPEALLIACPHVVHLAFRVGFDPHENALALAARPSASRLTLAGFQCYAPPEAETGQEVRSIHGRSNDDRDGLTLEIHLARSNPC